VTDKGGARCNEECARAAAGLVRTLVRLASHLTGWWLAGTLGAVAVVAVGWLARDSILDWWER
jgi:hypothetical protein